MILTHLFDVAPEPAGSGGFSVVLSFVAVLLVMLFTFLSLAALITLIVWRSRRKKTVLQSAAIQHPKS